MLIKAMDRKWAKKVLRDGLIRLHTLEYYRQWENDLLGDPNDGKGLYRVGGHPMEISSVNEVYVWCLSNPEISNERLHAVATAGKYNCVITIHQPEELIRRIATYLQLNHKNLSLHCGGVKYDRGTEVDPRTLNSQKFHFNVFQKESSRFQDDKEYRVSITNYSFGRHNENFVDLMIGDCGDIISLRPLPTGIMGR